MERSHPTEADATDPDAAARPTNRLANETSAYLRQHMHNPVDWYPWGEEALARARAEDKPLLVSIGYSACHWCHVMERESFEDPETAALMNERFVPIKVDREERPDVDQIYMDTVVRLTGHGGWPLTAFCTPDGRPFHAGTYFPPEPRHGLPSFRQVLEAAARVHREERDEVDRAAASILAALEQRPRGVAQRTPGPADLANGARALLERGDREHGGFGAAPKFPTPTNHELLLAARDDLAPEEARRVLDFVRVTCHEMSRRGCYDQLGGGFHRYCVDAHWGVPHFEKMLYDQGQLLRLYTEAWRDTGDDDLLWPVHETAAWLARDMTAPEGGFFASVDADSEGEEGRFYVWTPEQVEDVLPGDRAEAFCRAYAVTEEGNFEGRSVLWDVARGPRSDLAAERAALLEARGERVPPGTDRKRVAAWNGLAISGLAHAAGVLDDEGLREQARSAADFVLEHLRDDDGRLLRVFAEGRAKIPAFLDDVAAVGSACLDLHRAGAGDRYLAEGLALARETVERFWDEDEADLFLAPEDGGRLPHRPRSDGDGATPHSTGLAALLLVRAATLSGDERLRGVVERLVRTHAFAVERMPVAFPTLLRAAVHAERGLSVAVVVGDAEAPDTLALAARARRVLGPEDAVLVAPGPEAVPPGVDPAWLAGRERAGGRATASVCRGVTCSLPVTDPDALEPL